MSLHFPLPKFALFVSPSTLPVSPFTERSPLWRRNSQWVHTFHCQNFFRPLCSPSFKLNGTSRATSDRKPKTNDQIMPSPILFFPSKKWIKLIPKLLEIEKEIVREVARGDKPYLRKSTDRKAQIRKAFVQVSGLICALRFVSQVRFITPSHLTHNLFFYFQ